MYSSDDQFNKESIVIKKTDENSGKRLIEKEEMQKGNVIYLTLLSYSFRPHL